MSFVKNNKLRYRLSSVHEFIYKGKSNIIKDFINKDLKLLDKLNEKYDTVNKINFEETYSILKKEFFNEMLGIRHVALMLTGGMDSRIAASLLHEYIKETNSNLTVTVYTWGSSNSRDVIYSKRICNIFGWKFNHIKLTYDDFIKSVDLSKKINASVSPIHFHGINFIINDIRLNPVDKIIISSYGDSLGRGEYSGVNISKTKRLVENTYSKWSPFYSSNEKEILHSNICNEFISYNISNPDLIHEMTYQYCYMGMMLDSVFDTLREITSVYQIMTSDNFRLNILSYKRELRNDDFYLYILKNMNKKLANIPWARTGNLFGSNDISKNDYYSSIYHNYPVILRSLIKKNIFSIINGISLFNKFYFTLLLNFWKIFKTKKVTFYDEFFSTFYMYKIIYDKEKIYRISNDNIKINNFLIPYAYIFGVWLQEKLNTYK